MKFYYQVIESTDLHSVVIARFRLKSDANLFRKTISDTFNFNEGITFKVEEVED